MKGTDYSSVLTECNGISLWGLPLVNILNSEKPQCIFPWSLGDCPGAPLLFNRGTISHTHEPEWGERRRADLNPVTWNLLWI